MIVINRASQRRQFGHGNFHVDITFPGIGLRQMDDVGLVNLGRVDHAILLPGAFIQMHYHVNDEILSYVKSGVMWHKDSEGNIEEINPHRMMMMNAGAGIYHEESILNGVHKGNVEMLQVFIRPGKENDIPKVQFAAMPEQQPDEWRLVAGYASAPLTIRSEMYIWDVQIDYKSISLPYSPFTKTTTLLYVFNGSIDLDEKCCLHKGDSAIILDNDKPTVHALYADVVAFVMNTDAIYTRAGMFSGMN